MAPAEAQEPVDQAEIDSETFFNEGTRLAAEQKWQEASERLRASIKAKPSVGAYLNLARVYEHAGDLTRARHAVKSAWEAARGRDDVIRH